ncbi:Zinc finger CCHC-type protein [Macrophomina phaseolina MS6]|uniref:Zinc finger CCHC-type protein n=1 Tax=Macrophomina phaseolina (strain MS6) TaxID=1126212 RepID=K2RH19_MACPH|nr:Zinc finger CCHC-type protein [Macrophomina phaseolina MS6]
MQQPNHAQSPLYESRLFLAKQAIDQGKIQSNRGAAETYHVNRMTLKRRRDGTHSRRDCTPSSRKLTDPEKSVIVQRIIDLDWRGFPPRLSAVKDMANKLLADRAGCTVGKNWPSNFMKRTPRLKTRLKRKYGYQRAKCEGPELITQWFELVRNTIAKYGIVDGDMYNFDEAGFLMGMIAAGTVVTASEQRTRSKTVQSGNREWVTVMMAHSAVLLQAEAANLQRANEAATRRKKRQKKRIQKRGTLTIQAGQDLVDKNAVNQQISTETREGGAQSDGPATQRRRCGQCGKPGHNSRTCQKDAHTTLE